MTTFSFRDPRINVVASALADAAHQADQEDLQLGLTAYAEIAVRALDNWLIDNARESRTRGLPAPRIYGMKFCDCTELVAQIMDKPTPPERPARDN